MANNYGTKQLLKSSRKFYLVAIEPGCFVSDDLALVTGTRYSVTLPFDQVHKLTVDGVSYTKVSSTPGTGSFRYNTTTKLLDLGLGAALTTQVVVAYFYITITNGPDVDYYIDPFSLTGDFYRWRSRLLNEPSLEQKQQYAGRGVIEISNTDIQIANNDKFYNSVILDNVTFINKKCQIWHCLDSVENILRVYQGLVKDYSIDQNLNLSVDDALSSLNDTFYSNGSYIESTFNSVTYPNVVPLDEGKVIPKIYSSVSRFITANDTDRANSDVRGSALASEAAAINDGIKFVNVSKGTNLTYAGYVYTGGGSTIEQIGTSTLVSAVYYDLTGLTFAKYFLGDTVLIGAGQTPFRVIQVEAAKIRVFELGGSATYTPMAGDNIILPEVSVCQLVDPSQSVAGGTGPIILYLHPADFSLSTDANGVRQIVVSASLATNFTGFSGQPSNDAYLICRVNQQTPNANGTVVQEILESAGLDVVAISISNANAADIDLQFQYPRTGSSSFSSHRALLNTILQTTIGTISLDTSFDVRYDLLNTPSGLGTDITNDDIIRDSFSQSFSSLDIVDNIVLINEDNYIVRDISSTPGFGQDTLHTLNTTNVATIDIPKSRYFYEIIKGIELSFLLQTLPTSIEDKLKAIYGERDSNYTFEVKGRVFDKIIPQEAIVETDMFSGDSTEKDLVIYSIAKTDKKVRIIAKDLLNL